MIDWIQILDQHRIKHQDRGPSTNRGNTYVKCPWCGTSDHGFHLGISTNSPWRGYGCWRNSRHRGKSPSRLLAALLRIPEHRARELLGMRSSSTYDGDDFATHIRNTLGGTTDEHEGATRVEMPRELKLLGGKVTGESNVFIEYLMERGYAQDQV